jgi:pimeloyl-ACP methyl ester carboxylesterase
MKSSLLSQTDAVRTNCTEWGSGEQTCLLIHGFDEDSHSWAGVGECLSSRFTVLAPDLRGHGDSDWDPNADYDSERLLADLRATCTARGLTNLVVIGHSLGGQLAMLLAHENPDLVRALVMIDIGPDANGHALDRLYADTREAPRRFASVPEYMDYLQRRYPLAGRQMLIHRAQTGLKRVESGWLERKTDPSFLTCLMRQKQASPLLAASTSALRWAAWSDGRRPALIVRGLGSAVLSRALAGRMLELRSPSAELVEVQRSGHAVPMDNPDGLLTALQRFLDRI